MITANGPVEAMAPPGCLRCEQLQAKVVRLQEELVEYVEEAFRQIAYRQFDGWWDSQAMSAACSFGNKLVELGMWERDTTRGTGRWQWYRPLKSAC